MKQEKSIMTVVQKWIEFKYTSASSCTSTSASYHTGFV